MDKSTKLTDRIRRALAARSPESKGVVISLYEYTGTALEPWAKAGFDCFAFDIQHTGALRRKVGRGTISFIHADLWTTEGLGPIRQAFYHTPVKMLYGFPVCTDLAVSGARHFAAKRNLDQNVQNHAAERCESISHLADVLKNTRGSYGVPFVIENPVSRLSTLWRKPDHIFQPHQYGGYLNHWEAAHPAYPQYIPDFDCYSKRTCYWTGNGFIMPEPIANPAGTPKGYSAAYRKLGGKSARTKNIRSASPRGIAKAIFIFNRG